MGARFCRVLPLLWFAALVAAGCGGRLEPVALDEPTANPDIPLTETPPSGPSEDITSAPPAEPRPVSEAPAGCLTRKCSTYTHWDESHCDCMPNPTCKPHRSSDPCPPGYTCIADTTGCADDGNCLGMCVQDDGN
jgi:hypothetical protein